MAEMQHIRRHEMQYGRNILARQNAVGIQKIIKEVVHQQLDIVEIRLFDRDIASRQGRNAT
jgi:hypothetical protein